MTASRAIRVRMPDRPGQLSAIGAALAAHAVDITRLDVVAHDGDHVVDDLVLAADTQEQLDAAVAGFMPEVHVRFFSQPFGDPTVELADAIAAATSQGSAEEVRQSVVRSAAILGRAEQTAFMRVHGDGRVTVLAGPEGLPSILPAEAFPGRRALSERSAIAFPGDGSWAPPAFCAALGDPKWIVVAPSGLHDVFLGARWTDIRYYHGELERLAGFARAIGGLLALHGDRNGTIFPESWGDETFPEQTLVLPLR